MISVVGQATDYELFLLLSTFNPYNLLNELSNYTQCFE